MLKSFSFSIAAVVLGLAAALSAQDYEVVAVKNGVTISGTVKWAGPVPHLTPVSITKDPQICDPNSKKTRDLERLIIGRSLESQTQLSFSRTSLAVRRWICRSRDDCSTKSFAGTNRIFCWYQLTQICK